MALMLPYGGFTSGKPRTDKPPPPPSPPPPAGAAGAAPAGAAAAAGAAAGGAAAGAGAVPVATTAAAVPGAAPIGTAARAPVSALPCTKFMSFFAGSGLIRPSTPACRREYTYMIRVSGSNEPPAQTVPPPLIAIDSVPSGPSARLTTGGV